MIHDRVSTFLGRSSRDNSLLTLESPNPTHRNDFVIAARGYVASGEVKSIERYQQAVNDFDGFLVSLENSAAGRGLAANWVPTRSYFLLKDHHTVVGVARLRTKLTPAMALDGGHIGYDIVPCYRNLGYGTQLLRLTLLQAQALGLATVILTVELSNIGSIKIIERNGGRLSNEYVRPSCNARMRRYLIDTSHRQPFS